MATRIFDRKMKGSIGNAKADGSDPAVYSAAGVASVSDGSLFAAQFAGTELIGEPSMAWDIVTAGNATLVFTVPTGKYWRLVSAVVRVTADANAANRIVVSTTRDSGDSTIKAITDGTAVTANQDLVRQILYDLATNTNGNNRVQAQGTLTIAEPVTALDDFTVGDYTFTFVTALTQYGRNEILIGASEAATKLALNAAFVDQDNLGTLHNFQASDYAAWGVTAIDFAGDDQVFTVTEPGLAGSSIVFVEGTLTHGSNVLDGSGTFGGTTEGVDAVTNHSDVAWPTAGTVLTPAEDVAFTVTNGVAGDNFEVFLTYLEYDSDPT